MKFTILILFCVFAWFPFFPKTDSVDSDERDILETVFRHQIDHCYEDRSPKLYFLSYKGRDPSEALVERLEIQRASVRKRSQMGPFTDKGTGERGILCEIGAIDHRSPSSAEVRGSCGASLLDGYSYLYRLVRRNGKWTVKSRSLKGVS